MSTPTEQRFGGQLEVGDHLCYDVTELIECITLGKDDRKRLPLVGEITAINRLAGDSYGYQMIVTMGYDRRVMLNDDEVREVELPERSPMVAHRGTPVKINGVSIE